MFVGELDLDTKSALCTLEEGKAVDDGHRCLDGVITAVDVEVELLESDFGTRVDTDIWQHGADVRRCGLSLVRIGSGDPPRSTVELACQAHNFADRPLDVQDVCCLYTKHAARVTEGWEKHVRAVGLNDFANLVQSLEEDVVNLAGGDLHILDECLGCHDQIMKPLLRLQDVIHGVSRDDDLISSAQRNRARRRVSENRREHWRKVDRSTSGRLDHLDVAAMTTGNQTV